MNDSAFSQQHAPQLDRYEICVKGHLDSRRSNWFDCLSISLKPNGTTILLSEVVDQAALYGLLTKVRDLGMPLLSVNQVTQAVDDSTTTQ